MPEEGNKEKSINISNPGKDSNSEFIINRKDEKILGPEKENSFEKKIEDLINPPEGKEKVIKNDDLRRLATAATKLWNQTPENMDELLKTGNDWYLDSSKKIPGEEWEILAGLIYGGKSQLEAEQLKKTSSTVSSQGPAIDLDPLVNKISEGQEDLLNALKSQQITLEQFLNLSQKQTQNLSESLKRVSTKEERDRWLDVEYRQEFYTRFTPSLEPRFYTELKDEQERRLFDARWQLARAAYYKKAMSGFPEKMIDNQDLILLKTEQMEQLYNMPGVKKALEWYVRLIVNKEKVKMRDGREIDIFQCENESDFENFRENMRQKALSGELEVKDKKGNIQKIKLTNSEKKEADAVAWNWMWTSNLIESADSRYSSGGERHGSLAGDLVSDDLRAVFHPQEKFEDKCSKRQEWGVFGKSGVVQLAYMGKEAEGEIEKMKRKINFDDRKDKIKLGWLFAGATNSQYFWRYNGIKVEIKENKLGQRVISVNRKASVPECYPIKVHQSFWEDTSNYETKKNLLNYLLKKEEIPWKELGTGLWVNYLPIKLNKAVKLLDDYFKGKAHLEEGDENEWVKPLTDIFVRLKLDKDKKTFHNLKVWSVYAGIGGVIQPDSKTPALPLKLLDRAVTEERLRRPDIRFLERGERLNLSY